MKKRAYVLSKMYSYQVRRRTATGAGAGWPVMEAVGSTSDVEARKWQAGFGPGKQVFQAMEGLYFLENAYFIQ